MSLISPKSRPSARWFPKAVGLISLFLLWAVVNGVARINVVILPGRDSVQLTIYNSVDLTLVKETRHLTLRQGLNRLEFSWANTLIDPTSVEFQALTHADEVEVLDVSFPPRVTNILEWRINSEYTGEVLVEIRYFTSGISWAADYVVEADPTEQVMALAGQVRVTNHSGEDYEQAQVRLVVGVIRLVEEIAQMARAGRPNNQPMTHLLMERFQLGQNLYGRFRGGGFGGGGVIEKAKEITKEGLSEYFLYTVEGRDTIPNGWSKRLPSFQAADVPLASYYKFEREQWGDQVMRYYRFTNSLASKLGKEPLPDGTVQAFGLSTNDDLYSLVGRTSVKYIPIQETVELELGPDQEVLIKPMLMNWEKTALRFDDQGEVKGWTIKETWQVEMQNSKDIPVTLDIRRNFSGDWSVQTEAPYEKVDAHKVKFMVQLRPRERREFHYIVTTHYGINVTR